MASSLVIPSTKMFFSPFLSSGYVACQTSEHQSSQRGELDSKGVFPSGSRRQDALSEVQGRMTGSGKQDGVRAPCKAPRSAAALFPLPGGLGDVRPRQDGAEGRGEVFSRTQLLGAAGGGAHGAPASAAVSVEGGRPALLCSGPARASGYGQGWWGLHPQVRCLLASARTWQA